MSAYLRRFYTLIGIPAICILLASSCKHEGCTDPLSTNYDPEAKVDDGSCTYAAPTLAVHFDHVVGTQPFSTATVYTDQAGKRFQFTTARFYTSKPVLHSGGGDIALDKYLHVIAGEDATYPIGEVAAGDYTGFGFDIGIDSVTNHSDPLLYPEGHALSPLSPTNDHWTWNVGYVFLKIEGMTDTSAAQNGALNFGFQMHIATDPLLRHLSFAKNFTVSPAQNAVLNVRVDWRAAMEGFDYRRSTHTTDYPNIAIAAMDHWITGITLE